MFTLEVTLKKINSHCQSAAMEEQLALVYLHAEIPFLLRHFSSVIQSENTFMSLRFGEIRVEESHCLKPGSPQVS